MKPERLYSVIVPIYGVASYLPKCIESLLHQTYKNIEIILVDDGSRDGSSEICDRYASNDDRVRVLHKENGGLVSARKAGAKQAHGEYILCVDGDDWVADNYVELFDSVIEKYTPDLVCCGYIACDGENEIDHTVNIGHVYYDRARIEQEIYPIAIESDCGEIFPPQLWAKAFRRELYLPEQLSLDENIRIGEDGAVVKPILTKADSLFILGECPYYYRVNPESMTKKGSAYDFNGPRLIRDHLESRIDINSFDFKEQIIRRTAHDIYTVVFSHCGKNESYKNIRKEITDNLSAPDYKDILKNCRYKSPKQRLQLLLLRRHLILPIYILNKI